MGRHVGRSLGRTHEGGPGKVKVGQWEMVMTIQECLQILRDVKDVAFATVDRHGHPQVRIIDVMIVENETLYFCTSRGKEFHREVMESGRAAVTGMNREYQMVRLNGSVKKPPEQKAWIDRIFTENPSMNEVYPGDSRYILDAFLIEDGELEFFDLGKSPIYRESFALGSGTVTPKGFAITEACIGCGECESRCPQKCIDAGSPYTIRQENCLHCGLCFEVCPAGAIESRSVND
ncbi:4Fe-4S binding protein [Breznakiella homolactica]|uniref:4Fe-4S binding protein n=1 Tax=Breznakiella homolactica TaxID=2798577 RepID=A0A7T8B7M6_9SPIR|nr:4Fe-4S binding protein [Breznakiella homolactica]QQO07669.1 4Fe-4S binding protein [Breznakiella homolactica]